MPRRSDGWSRWSPLRQKLARSGHVFLLGLIIACGIEVLVDWNSTFFEISVLRDRVRERGVSYVSMLARSAARFLKSENRGSLTRLTDGLFDDEDVIFVRFTDEKGAVRFDRIDPDFAAAFLRDRGTDFSTAYAHQLARDTERILKDPAAEQTLMATSRYRDLAQRWNDAMLVATAFVSAPPPPRPQSALVLYQQALRTAEHTRDDAVTWAFATVEDEGSRAPVGVALVAFSMARTNAAIRAKYLKGLGMVVFFVGLIIVQSISSRRNKLRLLDIEARDARLKSALREGVPEVVTTPAWRAAAALRQGSGHEGMLVDVVAEAEDLWLLVLDPNGGGSDAMVVALHARSAFRSRRDRGLPVDLVLEADALAAASKEIPLNHALGLLLVRAAAGGEVSALLGPAFGLRRLTSGAAVAVDASAEAQVPDGLAGPLRRCSATLGPGEGLIAVCGVGEVDAVAAFALRSSARGLAAAVADIATWARGRESAQETRDLVVAAMERLPAIAPSPRGRGGVQVAAKDDRAP